MDEIEQFKQEVRSRIESYATDADFKELAIEWMTQSVLKKYVYNFTWLGRPIIQMPQDIVGLQEIIWQVNPDLIIETGIAHGGSLIFSASILELLGGNGKVLGVDIDIRQHNRQEIEQHSLFKRIEMIQGSSINDETAQEVYKIAADYENIMVVLDSNHTHAHVKKELELYSSLVGIGSYLVVLDTFIEDLPPDAFPDRPWNIGNNSKTAVVEFLKENNNFEIDENIENKLLLTSAPSGFLKRIR